ncbi:unnamed protein product [Peronospora effusa]|uniref:Uncharacterized protein n=1 Tax=Peronospora effusa TaxID=542832 RepID=A0A3M6VK06_9STRA|nr:hypothetical protein DD238_004030 [Peronospora effusa]RQM14279.1 hypothetical protein DD237_005140 [Peronospora effusa]CAI5701160.1 unnamed protein product [Peronospora effusa]
MADPRTTIPVNVFHHDEEEPEDEDTLMNIPASDRSSALMVKPPPLQVPEAGRSLQHEINDEIVYPWLHTKSSTVTDTTESSVMIPTTLYGLIHSDSDPWVREGETTALLAGSLQDSKSNVRWEVNSSLEYGTNVEMKHRHSILRMSASKTTSSCHELRKSASVEFKFDHVHLKAAQSLYASTSSLGREPRRLTVEEKAELYRIRPDLEIGPAPFFHEKVDELKRRNQRRIIFAMFGGMISVVLLLVFFSMWEYN